MLVCDLICIYHLAADKTIKIWETASGKCERTLEGHEEGVSDVSWSVDSKLVCSASDDNTVRIWDAQTVKRDLNDTDS